MMPQLVPYKCRRFKRTYPYALGAVAYVLRLYEGTALYNPRLYICMWDSKGTVVKLHFSWSYLCAQHARDPHSSGYSSTISDHN
jgi:hypothetical protein